MVVDRDTTMVKIDESFSIYFLYGFTELLSKPSAELIYDSKYVVTGVVSIFLCLASLGSNDTNVSAGFQIGRASCRERVYWPV